MTGKKLISSGWVSVQKRVMPFFGILVVGIFIVTSPLRGDLVEKPFLLIGPCIFGVFWFFMMKTFILNLADQVYDCGDSLLIRTRGHEARVLLSDIMNISASTYVNPPRITLRLATPCRFGSEISFSPVRKFSWSFYPKNPIFEDLMVRIDQARRQRPG